MVQTPGDAEIDNFDVVIVGGGPGGYAAALYGAAGGLSIAMIEKDKVGGTCLHRGCIPAKQFLETAAVLRSVRGASRFGISARKPTLDFQVSLARKNKVVDQLFRGLTGLLKKRKVQTIDGVGELQADNSVVVTAKDGSTRKLIGKATILATGSVPKVLSGFEPDGKLVLTSDEVLELSEIPASVAVVGGGAIGCEFASMLCDLGAKVTLFEATPTLLPGCDADVTEVVVKSFERRGIDVRTGANLKGHSPTNRATTVIDVDGDRIEVDCVVVAIGRAPLSAGLCADGSQVVVDERGFVVVDEWMRTGVEGVFAIGDLVATPQLAHVGFAEAILVIKQILEEPAVPIDYRKVPWCIYSHPEVAFVGVSEAQARQAGLAIVVRSDAFSGNGRAKILGETDGLVKVIAELGPDGRTGRILGVHMVGPWVTEQLGQGYLAVNWEATPDEISQFIQPHPSLSEAFGETVLALTGRGLHVG